MSGDRLIGLPVALPALGDATLVAASKSKPSPRAMGECPVGQLV
jgi:hypothetical protein